MFDVPALPSFDDSDWEAVITAFQHALALPFRQAWLPRTEENFRGGTVRLGWNSAGLWVLAEMVDDNVFSASTADKQRMWILGDVFEIFLRDLSGEEYLELHTTPNSHRLQLRFPSARTFAEVKAKTRKLDSLMVAEPLFHSRVRVTPTGWDVLACVPAGKAPLLRASFSRYDYAGPGTTPVVSSTSDHRTLDFHGQDGWLDFRLI